MHIFPGAHLSGISLFIGSSTSTSTSTSTSASASINSIDSSISMISTIIMISISN